MTDEEKQARQQKADADQAAMWESIGNVSSCPIHSDICEHDATGPVKVLHSIGHMRCHAMHCSFLQGDLSQIYTCWLQIYTCWLQCCHSLRAYVPVADHSGVVAPCCQLCMTDVQKAASIKYNSKCEAIKYNSPCEVYAMPYGHPVQAQRTFNLCCEAGNVVPVLCLHSCS